MHCLACNAELTDTEATRKDIRGNYLDMCSYCYFQIKSDVTLGSNFDLNIIDKHDEDLSEE